MRQSSIVIFNSERLLRNLIDFYLNALKLNDNDANKISRALKLWGQNEHDCKKVQKSILVFLIFGMC